MEKLLSVIVPVYNVENYIEECLNSIVDQTIGISHIEVLIIDDCSPDKSINIVKKKFLKKYPGDFKIIVHEANKGLGGARNTGIDNASTDYVFFLDSDDALYPNALELLYTQIKNNKADVAIGSINNFNENLELLSVYQKNKPGIVENFSDKFLRNEIKMFNVVVWNKLYSKQVLQNIRFFEKIYFEDEPFSLHLNTKAKKVVWIEEPVYKYRRRAESITSTDFNRKHLDSLKIIYSEALKVLKKNIEFFGKWLEEKIRVTFRKFQLSDEQKKQYFDLIEGVIQNEKYEELEIYGFFDILKNTVQPHKDFFSENTYFSTLFKSLDKVSVIIPTFKRPESLKSSIDSVLNQTYSNIEIIVVDDNEPTSEDRAETESLMKAYSNVIYIKHDKNRNAAAARNSGIKRATGEYISFLNDDDVYMPEKIKRSVETIKKYSPEYGAIYCGYLGCNSDANDLNRYKEGNLTYDLLTLQYKNHYLCTNTVLYKSYTLKRIEGFDESFNRHQDLELNLKFFQFYKIGTLKEALVSLRPQKTKTENWLDSQKFYNLKLKYLRKFEYIINSFSASEQEEIYFKNWNEVNLNFKSIADFMKHGATIENRSDMLFLVNPKVLLPLSDIDERLSFVNNKKDELESASTKSPKEIVQLIYDNIDLQSRLDIFVQRTTRLTNEITAYKVKIYELQNSPVERLNGDLKKQEEQNNALNTLNREVSEKNNRINLLEEEKNKAIQQNEELKKELANLYNQKKWFVDTYEHLPKWYVLLGSIFRRIRFKK